MRVFATLSLAVAIGASASAQETAKVTIPASLAQSIYLHLTQGGTISAGSRLAEDLQEAAAAPGREAELRRQIAAELEAKKAQDAPAK